MPRDDHGLANGGAYSRAALDRACEAIRNAPFGRQESTLNTETLRIGGLIGSGLLDHAEARSALLAAGLSMPSQARREPWTRADVERKVDHALADGRRSPRGAPPRARERRPAGRARDAAEAPAERRFVCAYDYRDEDRNLLFQVVRWEPKGFSQRRQGEDGRWAWSVKGVRLVPYRLPELLAAPASEPVFIPEGEKDVNALRGLGLAATCNPMGEGDQPPSSGPGGILVEQGSRWC